MDLSQHGSLHRVVRLLAEKIRVGFRGKRDDLSGEIEVGMMIQSRGFPDGTGKGSGDAAPEGLAHGHEEDPVEDQREPFACGEAAVFFEVHPHSEVDHDPNEDRRSAEGDLRLHVGAVDLLLDVEIQHVDEARDIHLRVVDEQGDRPKQRSGRGGRRQRDGSIRRRSGRRAGVGWSYLHGEACL